ncbi:ABC transporter substrate-binding protein, partial [Desulfobacterales bacterium HSG2]|nr:ABC transporter substrate-binding protein [Desulfobacterales bacterium HSG2]
TYEEITPVQVGLGMDAFLNDEIDVLAAFMNIQPLLLKEQGFEDFTYMPAFSYGYDFYSGVYFAAQATIEKQPDMVRRFTEVTLRGWQEAFRDPAAAAKQIIETYAPKESLHQQTESLKIFRMLAKLGDGKKFLGWMESEYWAKGIDILHQFRQIEKKIPVKDVFASEFLKTVYFGKK